MNLPKLKDLVTLNEMPKLQMQLEPELIEVELLEPIKKAIEENKVISIEKADMGAPYNVGVIHSKGEMIFLIVTNGKLVGAVKVVKQHKNIQVHLTKKFEKNFKHLMTKLYKVIYLHLSKKKKVDWFLSDNKQTNDSAKWWKDVWKNPSKYDIKSVTVFEMNKNGSYKPVKVDVDMKENDIWGWLEKHKKYVIGIKY